MTDQLPKFARFIFTKAEPLSLLAGFIAAFVTPKYFITSQLPTSSLSLSAQTILNNIVAQDKTTTLLAWQLGNAYLLLGLLGVFILNTTSELSVVNAYLLALWLGDIGHLAFTLYSMGWQGTLDVGSWNATVWGSVGITSFLFATRSVYFLGLFDSDSPLGAVKAKKAVKATEKKGRKH